MVEESKQPLGAMPDLSGLSLDDENRELLENI